MDTRTPADQWPIERIAREIARSQAATAEEREPSPELIEAVRFDLWVEPEYTEIMRQRMVDAEARRRLEARKGREMTVSRALQLILIVLGLTLAVSVSWKAYQSVTQEVAQ